MGRRWEGRGQYCVGESIQDKKEKKITERNGADGAMKEDGQRKGEEMWVAG